MSFPPPLLAGACPASLTEDDMSLRRDSDDTKPDRPIFHPASATSSNRHGSLSSRYLIGLAYSRSTLLATRTGQGYRADRGSSIYWQIV
ncbi:hypothetical protein MW887_000145 [Aspergillus wentii]|nr:hypothetical protein MW887_000145 [Aspergillus wentii]